MELFEDAGVSTPGTSVSEFPVGSSPTELDKPCWRYWPPLLEAVFSSGRSSRSESELESAGTTVYEPVILLFLVEVT